MQGNSCRPTEQAPVPQPATTSQPTRTAVRFATAGRSKGLAAIGNVEEILKTFRQQSALEADRKKPANAAQVSRRSRADADLLARIAAQPRLLRCRRRAADRTRRRHAPRRPRGCPGQQYRFASVELPGLDGGGSGGRKAARGVRGEGRRPGHCRRCDRGGHCAHDGARRERLCQRQNRRAADRGQSPDTPRQPGAAGRSGARGAVRRDPGQRRAAVQRAAMSR